MLNNEVNILILGWGKFLCGHSPHLALVSSVFVLHSARVCHHLNISTCCWFVKMYRLSIKMAPDDDWNVSLID